MADPVAVLRLEGDIRRASVRRRCEELAGSQTVRRLLADLRDITDPLTEADRVGFACHLVVFFGDAKVAMLGRMENTNHVAEAVAVRAGMQVQLFFREDAAREWLAAP